jgi:hypothetical protein
MNTYEAKDFGIHVSVDREDVSTAQSTVEVMI